MAGTMGVMGVMGVSGAMGVMGVSGAMGVMGVMGVSGANANSDSMNGMLIDALNKTRHGLVDEPNQGLLEPNIPQVEDASNLRRWDSSVRMKVYVFDLLSQLQFQSNPKLGSAEIGHISFKQGKGKAANTFEILPIASITRPKDTKLIAFFQEQLKLVESWSELREERASEIMCQVTPQFSFWNAIAHLSLETKPKTLELMLLGLQLCAFAEVRFKHALSCPRPVDYSTNLQPIIPTPTHATLPSGHATESFFMAHMLECLLPKGNAYHDQLQGLATRVAINRTIAGLHFPADSQAGQMLGQSLAEYFVALCKKDNAKPTWQARSIDLNEYDSDDDFLTNPLSPGDVTSFPAPSKTLTPIQWLWDAATAECSII